MLDILRLGVREMVEFTLHGEDICFSGGVRVMQEGTAAHKARQALLTGEGWQKEVPLEREIPVEEGDFTFLLSGRMDAFLDGDCPVVEEIKLWSSQDDPEEPQQAHTAQALVYAWMLFQERETLCKIETRVAYVSVDGTLRGMFTRQLSPGECRADFDALFVPFKEQTLFLRRRLQERNRELDALTFPFPAYRAGQREYAVQVYTAIERRKRLFASMPTGTGKSVAGLFPALKALGRGLTGQIFYLTARSTQRQGALDALRLMRPSLPHLHVLTLDARDRVCPESHICHPDFCPRAKGHFLRDLEAVGELLQTPDWTDACIREAADRHCLCPFELSLTLSPMADVVICDYNYALDPAVHLQRIFDRTDQVTLLLDEAHHLLPRIRDMLSGTVDAQGLTLMRRQAGRLLGRRHPLYAAMTEMLHLLSDLQPETTGVHLPENLPDALSRLLDLILETGADVLQDPRGGTEDVLSGLLAFQRALKRPREEYVFLVPHTPAKPGKPASLKACCMNAASHFAAVTEKLSGTVCFSATLHPLSEMKRLLGGSEDDACFAVPSPFPPEHLLVLIAPVNVRYTARDRSVPCLIRLILDMVLAHPGRYLVFFPSFAYMEQTAAAFPADQPGPCLFQTQKADMSLEERAGFLEPYMTSVQPVLSFCVMGGIFSEGIDLPHLDGVMVVGTGLAKPDPEQLALQTWYSQQGADGFLCASQIPGMQKVAQAAGRVIRSEKDRGVVILADDRFRQADYLRLMPAAWHPVSGKIPERLEAFWNGNGKSRDPDRVSG